MCLVIDERWLLWSGLFRSWSGILNQNATSSGIPVTRMPLQMHLARCHFDPWDYHNTGSHSPQRITTVWTLLLCRLTIRCYTLGSGDSIRVITVIPWLQPHDHVAFHVALVDSFYYVHCFHVSLGISYFIELQHSRVIMWHSKWHSTVTWSCGIPCGTLSGIHK